MQPHLNDAMRKHLASVRDSVTQVLPKLLAAQSYDADLFTVRETVLRYLEAERDRRQRRRERRARCSPTASSSRPSSSTRTF